MGIVDDLQRARVAFERRDWATAYDRLTAADAESAQGVGADELMTLGMAAFLLGDIDACIRALQRGYRLRIGDGEVLGAVRFAYWLARVHIGRGERAVGSGWAARAERLLADHPGDTVESGYLM